MPRVLTASGGAISIFLGSLGRAGFYSLTSLKINPCSRPAQWSLKHLSHARVSYKQQANPSPFKMAPSNLGDPFQQLPFVTAARRVLSLKGIHNEPLYTHAVIIRSIIISHIYITCFHLSESQGILHIILLIIK